ncbi:MAG: beta-galactosidase [Candidatus Omnitrophota bacterium]
MRTLVLIVLILFQCTTLCADNLRIGTTYSPIQSRYLDLDWKKTYLAILELGFDVIRLGAYWNEIEKEKGVYDFTVLDWQIKEAGKKGIPVILTVGMKAPRWPEYFIPDWVIEKSFLPFGADVSKDDFLKKRTLIFIEKVVDHYKRDPIIRYWQVENEPLDRIGEKHWLIGKDFLKQEVELVRKLDGKKRPILLTAATYPNAFQRFLSRIFVKHDPIRECLELCDVLGLNVYPVIGQKVLFMDIYFRTTRQQRDMYFSKVISIARSEGKDVWIMELQAEPWEPGHLVYKEKKQPLTGNPEEVKESFEEFRNLGVDTILLWGAEYWHYRETRHKDAKWQNTVRGLIGAQ